MAAYPDGHGVRIAVELTGCAAVASGDVVRTAFGSGNPREFGPQLVVQLKRLTR